MSDLSALLPFATAPIVQPVAPGWQLITGALAAIALIVLLITVLKVHPFLALIGGAITVGAVAGESVLADADGKGLLPSFTAGFGSPAAITFGPGDFELAHMVDEHIAIAEVAEAAQVYAQATLELLR